MNYQLYEAFLCDKFKLEITEETSINNERYIRTGNLISNDDGQNYRISNYIIRFREDAAYTESFSYQWEKFPETQLDSKSKKNISEERLLSSTKWIPENLVDKMVLECGCGGGRFSELFHRYNAILICIDYSNAIDVTKKNIGLVSNVLYCQADITMLPFGQIADYVFCHGVLQHTPSPQKTFDELCKYMKPKGQLSIDIYRKELWPDTWYYSKYIWRPITRRVNRDKLLKFIRWYVPKYIPFDSAMRRLPFKLGRFVLGIIPIPCFNSIKHGFSREEQIERAVLDTFDALATYYDYPASPYDLRKWCKGKDLNYEIFRGGNGLVLNAESW